MSKKPDKPRIDHAIDETFNAYNPEADDAMTKLKLLKGLHAIKAQHGPKRADPNTIWLVIGNVVGIALIVGHERANVVTSKAIGMIKPPR